jgi:hypothetical protein
MTSCRESYGQKILQETFSNLGIDTADVVDPALNRGPETGEGVIDDTLEPVAVLSAQSILFGHRIRF